MRKFLLTTSWDDGAEKDLKLAEVLQKYNIPATFYIPIKDSERRVLDRGKIREIGKEFEIGGHSYSHVDLTKLSEGCLREEIIKGKNELEEIIGRRVVTFAYPFGAYNLLTKQEVEFAGFDFARTTHSFGSSIGDKFVASPTVHAYKHSPLSFLNPRTTGWERKSFYSLILSNNFSLDWEKLARSLFEFCLKNKRIFHLWGHSWEIEENNDWKKLERVLKYISQNSNVASRKTNYGLIQKFEEYKLDYYNGVGAEAFEGSYHTGYYNKELELIKVLTKKYDKKGKSALDIGCGTGRVADTIVKAEYLGIDFSQKFIGFARKKRGGTKKKFICADFKDLDKLSLKKQDLIVIWGLPENPSVQIRFIIRLLSKFLKPKGRTLVVFRNIKSPIYRILRYLRTEFFEMPFPYTTSTPEFLMDKLKRISRKHNLKFRMETFGLIPPFHPLVPALNYKDLGCALIIIINKRSEARSRP